MIGLTVRFLYKCKNESQFGRRLLNYGYLHSLQSREGKNRDLLANGIILKYDGSKFDMA